MQAITDQDILKLFGRKNGKAKTAADIGVPAGRLKAVEGVEVVGTHKVEGKRGRPALLFKRVA